MNFGRPSRSTGNRPVLPGFVGRWISSPAEPATLIRRVTAWPSAFERKERVKISLPSSKTRIFQTRRCLRHDSFARIIVRPSLGSDELPRLLTPCQAQLFEHASDCLAASRAEARNPVVKLRALH